MKVEELMKTIECDFYIGVPDSQLKALCDCLMDNYGIDQNHHVIAANEGNCVAMAAGYYLATEKIPCVYMQNSGIGNIINPVASLLNDKVYAIPMIFIIGWRGEPNIVDEPQHIYQGEITIKLLEDMGIEVFIISQETTDKEVREEMSRFRTFLALGRNVAFVVRKGALTYEDKITYENQYSLLREEVIRHIIDVSDEDPVICTTGKASRELFEIRESNGQCHKYDFLTVGSMGHTSSIALGIAINKPNNKVWCIDGDGAFLMHMGSVAVLGASSPENMIHVVINNGAHETVGGMPTVASKIDMVAIAKACGYPYAVTVDNIVDLDKELAKVKSEKCLCFLEVKCAIGSRGDLGRPTTSAIDNKVNFMEYLLELG